MTSARQDLTDSSENRNVAVDMWPPAGVVDEEDASLLDLELRKSADRVERLGSGRGTRPGGWKKGGMAMQARRWASPQALMKRMAQVGSACMWAQLRPMAYALSSNSVIYSSEWH